MRFTKELARRCTSFLSVQIMNVLNSGVYFLVYYDMLHCSQIFHYGLCIVWHTLDYFEFIETSL